MRGGTVFQLKFVLLCAALCAAFGICAACAGQDGCHVESPVVSSHPAPPRKNTGTNPVISRAAITPGNQRTPQTWPSPYLKRPKRALRQSQIQLSQSIQKSVKTRPKSVEICTCSALMEHPAVFSGHTQTAQIEVSRGVAWRTFRIIWTGPGHGPCRILMNNATPAVGAICSHNVHKVEEGAN